jgi:monoterpene epsilon-lactone hydrolase
MPKAEAVRAIQEWRDLVSGPRGTLAESRQHAEDFFAKYSVPPELKLEHAEVGGIPGDWLTMPGADAKRVVLYIHGGAFVLGSPRGYRSMCARLAKATRARIFAVDYRLAPESPFPAAIQDAADAYRGIVKQGVAPSSIVIAGDSAGGNLTVATLLSLRESEVPLPAAGVCISPWVDLECAGETMKTKANVDPLCEHDSMLLEAGLYLNGHTARDPLASPIHADLHGLPPLLIQVGTEETLLDDSTRLAKRAEEAGVPVTLEIFEGMPHVWHVFADYLPEAQQAIEKIGEFVIGKTARASTTAG